MFQTSWRSWEEPLAAPSFGPGRKSRVSNKLARLKGVFPPFSSTGREGTFVPKKLARFQRAFPASFKKEGNEKHVSKSAIRKAPPPSLLSFAFKQRKQQKYSTQAAHKELSKLKQLPRAYQSFLPPREGGTSGIFYPNNTGCGNGVPPAPFLIVGRVESQDSTLVFKLSRVDNDNTLEPFHSSITASQLAGQDCQGQVDKKVLPGGGVGALLEIEWRLCS